MASHNLPCSGSDDDLSSLGGDISRKRGVRRRRGRHTHRTKNVDSPQSDDLYRRDEDEDEALLKRRRRTNSVGAPPAPYNTTQFLLEDREHRVEEEEGGRRRTMSSSDGIIADGDESSSSEGALSGEEQKDKAMEEEFEDDYREAAFLKYTEMNHEELARSMVEVEESRDRVSEALESEKKMNAQLKEIIRNHNLPFDTSPNHHQPHLASPRA